MIKSFLNNLNFESKNVSDSSGEESVFSAQDYETEECRDSSADDSSNDNSNDISNDNSIDLSNDDSSNEELVYRVEYEVDNGSDEENDDSSKRKYDSSAEDSDLEVSFKKLKN